MDEDWLCEKLENLKIEETRIYTLTEIRRRLNEAFCLDAKVTERLLSSPEIFNCVDDEVTDVDNSKHMELVTDILSKCMSNLSIRKNSDVFRLLHRALVHKQKRIRALALNVILKEIQKHLEQKKEVSDIISLELLHHILLALQDRDVHIGQTACKILCLVLENYIDEPSINNAILQALKKSDVIKCRLYDVAVEFGNRTPAILGKFEFIIDHALSELDNDDVVLQVNILEILGVLTKHNAGISYLEKRQVFDVLGKRIEEMDHNPLDRLLIPSMMKLFGTQPQKIISGYPHVMRFLFLCFYNGDCDMLPIAFDTIVNLTQIEQGVVLLERHYASDMNAVFECYSTLLKNLPTNLKVRAFDSLRRLFLFEDNIFPTLSLILQRWFTYLSNATNNMQFLMDFCKNPFTDIKFSALGFVRSVIHYPWGIEALQNTAGFLEYLLDRNTEFDDSIKYIKFCIVNILANSSFFDLHINIQLRQYVNDGPYFAPVVMEVAIERNQ